MGKTNLSLFLYFAYLNDHEFGIPGSEPTHLDLEKLFLLSDSIENLILNGNIELATFSRRLLEKMFVSFEKRQTELVTLTATERYLNFMKRYEKVEHHTSKLENPPVILAAKPPVLGVFCVVTCIDPFK